MRAAAFLIACSGCLITEPDGAPQSWPPQLGGTVESVVAGDLDGNGSTDVVVMMSGASSQAGLYYLESDTDLIWASGDVFRSFSRFVPMELVHPVGAVLDAGPAPQLWVATGTETLAVSLLTNDLTEIGYSGTTVAGSGIAWTSIMNFPGAQPHIVVSNGSTIDHLDRTMLIEPRPLPAPMSPTWDLAQLATSYTDGTTQKAVVATADMIYRCVIPTTPGAMFMWENVRDAGAPWLGQTAYDFDGDGREEIVGFDLQNRQLCVVDPGSATPVTPSCVPLTSTFTGTDVTIIAGTNLSMSPGLDILVVQASGTETNYTLAEDVTYTGGVLNAATVLAIPFAGPPRGRTVTGTPGLGRPHSVLTFGADGAAVCALGPC